MVFLNRMTCAFGLAILVLFRHIILAIHYILGGNPIVFSISFYHESDMVFFRGKLKNVCGCRFYGVLVVVYDLNPRFELVASVSFCFAL